MIYTITVYDEFFKLPFKGEFESSSREQAIEDAQNFYAHELDINPEDVQIIKIEQKGTNYEYLSA